jgi:hypothetical protein
MLDRGAGLVNEVTGPAPERAIYACRRLARGPDPVRQHDPPPAAAQYGHARQDPEVTDPWIP